MPMSAQRRVAVRFTLWHPIPWLLLILSAPGFVEAGAQSSSVRLPIALSTWAEPIRTSACLQVIERHYPDSAWWESATDEGEPADRAFKAVVAALRHKDRDALWKLSDPDLGRDAKQFDQQATALF